MNFQCYLTGTLILLANFAFSSDVELNLPDGFSAELIYKVPNRQGSWVSLTADPKGRLIASDQFGGLYRIDVSVSPVNVEPIPIKLGFAQGLLCAFDSLYVVAHAGQFNKLNAQGEKVSITRPAGLYRVQSSNDNDVYDSIQLLRKFEGGGEHGPHAVVLGPDKTSLYICAGNYTRLPKLTASRVPQLWQEDQLTPRLPDAGGHAVGITAPGGWICKTDPDGENFELISSGFRNPYDIAFDSRGELFTYDADMEWDIGLPWYRPTRVCHVVSGGEFGWRNGSGKWPTYFPDSVPPVLDIGPGSPTGITFGSGGQFPVEYQQALFIADWSFGIIYKIDMTCKDGAYAATKQIFCTAPVLPVTDVIINAVDGAMYFTVGGRRSQSALYRIRYTGTESTTPIVELDSEVDPRRKIERFHKQLTDENFEEVWKALRSSDRSVRFAARTALELQGGDHWYERAFNESDPQTKLESLLALIRLEQDSDLQSRTIDSLQSIDFEALTQMQQLHLLRNYGLVLMRMGPPTETTLTTVDSLSRYYPHPSDTVNRELSRLLAAAEADDVVPKTLALMWETDSQKQQIHYATILHGVKKGWNFDLQKQFLQWFKESTQYAGGGSFRNYLSNIRDKFAGELNEERRQALKDLIDAPLSPTHPMQQLQSRPIVNRWAVEDLDDIRITGCDTKNGMRLYSITQCAKCHIAGNHGGVVGPNLTSVARRLNTHDLLKSILNPNQQISDQYQATHFLLDDGRIVTGRIANLVRDEYHVQEDLLNPSQLTRIRSSEIDQMKPSQQSMMPSGLLDTLNKDEIADLIAYLREIADQQASERFER